MKILAIEQEQPGLTEDDFTPFLKEEARRVWELQQLDVIRETWFRSDREEAVLILECRDKNEAEEYLNTLPLVREKLISFELIPLIPYPGLERLFRETI